MPSQRRKFKIQLKHFPTFSSKTLLFVWLSWLLSSYCKFYNVDISMFWIGPFQYLNNFSLVLSIFAVISAYFKWSLELYLSHWRQIYLRSSWQRVWKALTWQFDNWHWQFHHWHLTHILSVNFQFCRKKLWNTEKKAKIHGKIYIWRRNMQTYILMSFKGFKYAISEIKVIFTAIHSDIDFFDLGSCWWRAFYSCLKLPCQILCNPLISGSFDVDFRNHCAKNYGSTNFHIIWINISQIAQFLRKNYMLRNGIFTHTFLKICYLKESSEKWAVPEGVRG